MQQQPGYPLPAGDLGNDEIVCQLVFLPNRPEYWQAFISSLHYFATWRAWERDTDKRGKDAASDWSQANELTMECWRMTCLQTLQDNVAEILAIMQLGNQCCDDQDITGGERYTDRVTDGEGDVPQNVIDAGYATDTSDWAGFDDYKCMISHVTVNQMEARLREIAEVVDSAGPYLALAAALSAIIGVIVTAGGLAIVFGMLTGIGVVSALYYALTEFGPVDDLADDVATNHDELACAIYNADGDEGALVALDDKIDELFSAPEALILKNLNNGPTLKSLYAGRYDQQDIAEILFDAGYELNQFNCLCDVIELNGWEIVYDQDLQITEYEAPPNCDTVFPGAYLDLHWTGTYQQEGDMRIQGYIFVEGKYDLHANCIDAGRFIWRCWFGSDPTSNPRPGGSPTYRILYEADGDYPTGYKSERYDFDETYTIANARWFTMTRSMIVKHGDCDINVHLVITSITGHHDE